MDEILVKGADNKWYVAREGKLILQDDVAQKEPVVPVAKLAPQSAMPLVVPAARPIPAANTILVKKEIPKAAPVIDVIKTPEILPPIEKIALTTAPAPHLGDSADDFEKILNECVSSAKLNFPDPSLTKRFKLLVASRLREVRRADDVHALLSRETKVGGLGLSETEAERVLAVIEKSFVEFHKKWEQVEADRKAAVLRSREEAARKTQAVMVGEPMIDEAAPITPKGISAMESLKSAPAEASSRPSLPKEMVAVEKKIEPFTKASPLNVAPKPLVKIQTQASTKPTASVSVSTMPSSIGGAPTVTDIRKPKLFGPADELREMKLVDFRRMGSASEAATRIKSKIDMLGSESLTKKREAVAAWKQSEIYTVYADMMAVAMAQGKSIDREINDRAKSGKNSLTIDEIDAIMGLNELLRQ